MVVQSRSRLINRWQYAMYPNRFVHKSSIKKQKGFLLPLALFIMLVMGSFAVVLSRNTIQTSTSAVLELITVQTFYAAESGAQRGMQILFYPDPTVRQTVDNRCASMNSTFNFTETGLKNCSAVVTCTCLYQDNSACDASNASNYSPAAPAVRLSSFYKVNSIATCGTGTIRSTRTIEVGSFLRQE